MHKNREELRNLSGQDLITKIESYKRDLFTLRLNASNTHVKDYSQFNKLRKNVARALTYLRQKSK